MNKTDKETVVAKLTEQLESSPNIYLTDFSGISVKDMTDLRRRFRANGAEFRVIKNTLAARVFADRKIDGLDDALNGPTGFIFAGSDPVQAAKVLAEFQKEQEDKPAVKAGFVDGQAVGPAEVKRLADLPGREELLGQLAGAMQGPLQAFVGAMNGVFYQFAGVVEALRAERDA